ncbi:MAG: type II toxin-antitoxin system VapC family toxin [Acidobacteria bacterium]|nr:type II toxin-antitoxin system VapC family toxin [Acidobacteriota bacterium]
MTAIVDASVLVAAVSDSGPTGEWAEDVVAGPLIAPDLALVEATNILRRFEMTGLLESLEASEAARDLLDLDIEVVPFLPFANRIWDLRRSLTAYDAWYVAIAEEMDLPLATLDGKLAAANGPTCRFVTP